MSNLAPFVAAVLRDQTVQELHEENERLRQQVHISRLVQITGPGGVPVYAEGRIDEGRPAGNPNLWLVKLERPPGSTAECQLHQLGTVEVRIVGGMLHASFERAIENELCETFLDRDDVYDTDTSKHVGFCFAETAGGLWLSCDIQNWPRQRWSRVLEEEDQEDVFDYLTLTVAAQPPSRKTVRFFQVQFFQEQTRFLLAQMGISHTGADEEHIEYVEVHSFVLGVFDQRFPHDFSTALERHVRLSHSRIVTEALVEWLGHDEAVQMVRSPTPENTRQLLEAAVHEMFLMLRRGQDIDTSVIEERPNING